MAITAGEDAVAADFISTSGGSADSGKVAKLNSDGFLDNSFVNEKYTGDGSDGDVTISSNQSLSEDKYYNNLTINSGAELDPNGYKIFVKEKLTVDDGKIVRTGGNGGNGENGNSSGTDAQGGDGGTAPAAGTLAAGTDGGPGGDAQTDSGSNGGSTSVSHALGSAGAAGGDGGDGTEGGGTGGSGASGGAANSPTRPLIYGFSTAEFADVDIEGDGIVGYRTNGSSGGGGAGGGESGSTDSGGAGGGGGADGGPIVIYANEIEVNASGTIEANGGNGGDGGDAGTGCGGGGGGAGGNGGVIVLFYKRSYTNNGTVQALAGSGGAAGSGGNANGTAGSNGNAGTIITKQITSI